MKWRLPHKGVSHNDSIVALDKNAIERIIADSNLDGYTQLLAKAKAAGIPRPGKDVFTNIRSGRSISYKSALSVVKVLNWGLKQSGAGYRTITLDDLLINDESKMPQSPLKREEVTTKSCDEAFRRPPLRKELSILRIAFAAAFVIGIGSIGCIAFVLRDSKPDRDEIVAKIQALKGKEVSFFKQDIHNHESGESHKTEATGSFTIDSIKILDTWRVEISVLYHGCYTRDLSGRIIPMFERMSPSGRANFLVAIDDLALIQDLTDVQPETKKRSSGDPFHTSNTLTVAAIADQLQSLVGSIYARR
jgi:hypothetical protein